MGYWGLERAFHEQDWPLVFLTVPGKSDRRDA